MASSSRNRDSDKVDEAQATRKKRKFPWDPDFNQLTPEQEAAADAIGMEPRSEIIHRIHNDRRRGEGKRAK